MINREVSLSAMTRVMSAGGAYVLNLVLARSLSKPDYGEFAVGVAAVIGIAFVTKLGFDSIILRDIAAFSSKDDNQGASAINSFGNVMTALLSFPTAIIGAAISYYYFQYEVLAILFLSLPAVTWISMTASIFKALDRAPTAAFFEVGGASMLALLLFSLYYFSWSVDITVQQASWMYVAASWALVLIGRTIRPGMIRTLWPREFMKHVDIRSTLTAAGDFTQTSVTQYLSNWAGVLLLGWMISKGDAAVFSIALRTSLLINFVWQVISAVYSNKIAGAHEAGDHEGVRRITRKAANTLCMLSTPGVFMLMAAPLWLTKVFGPEYADAVVPLQVLSIGQLVYSLAGVSLIVAWMTGYESAARRIFVYTTILLLVSSVALIHFYGVLGAAWAVSIALTLRTVLAVKLVNGAHKFWPVAVAA